jgi:hypothetical protein
MVMEDKGIVSQLTHFDTLLSSIDHPRDTLK